MHSGEYDEIGNYRILMNVLAILGEDFDKPASIAFEKKKEEAKWEVNNPPGESHSLLILLNLTGYPGFFISRNSLFEPSIPSLSRPYFITF